jgi:thiol-disulfide isomerase/thioredoxin
VTGVVLTPDGKPAAGAEVLVATPSQQAEVRDGTRGKSEPERVCFVLGDESGRFMHKPQNESFELIFLHPSGAARVTEQQFTAMPGRSVTLKPWGRIEGSVVRDGKPIGKAQLTLSNSSHDDPDEPGGLPKPRVQLFRTEETGKDGKFVFEHVFPARYRLSAQHTQQGMMGFSGPGVPLAVEPGQAIRMDFGVAATRGVVGRLVTRKPEAGLDWSKVKLMLKANPRERGPREKPPTTEPRLPDSVAVAVKPDGTFRIDAVSQSPTGAWLLTLDGSTLPPRAGDSTGRSRDVKGGTSFELPASPGGENPPIDVGDVEAQVCLAEIGVGMTAPPIEATTLDGKPLKLSDYQGKYVLLDFWATWCGPCVAETPYLKKVYDAFGKDGRFVMIGLSMDSGPDEALDYVRRNQMDWVQGFLGMWGKHPAAGEYGVNGIPTIMLIGPDGKIVARDVRGEQILGKVKEALSTERP